MSRRWIAVMFAAVTALALVGMTRITADTSQATFTSSASRTYTDNERYQEAFGGEAMLALFTGDDAVDLLADGNLQQLAAIEEELRGTGRFHAVVGPLTALQFSNAELAVATRMIDRARATELAAAPDDVARAIIEARYAGTLTTELARLGAAGEQTLSNPKFVRFLLFEPDGQVRPIMRDNFPDDRHGLLVARLPAGASAAEQRAAADAVRDAIEKHPLAGFTALATGAPAVASELSDDLARGLGTLGAAGMLTMAAVVVLVLRRGRRLVPALAAVAALVWSFGALGLSGVPLTIATLVLVPPLVAVAISTAAEVHDRGTPFAHGLSPFVAAAVAVALAAVALLRAETPMLRDLAVALPVTVAASIAAAVVVPALARRVAAAPIHTAGTATVTPARAVHATVTAVAVVLAVLVAFGGAGAPDAVDSERWANASGPALTDVRALRSGAGFTSEIGVLVEADDVTATPVVAWMERFATELVERHDGEIVRRTSMPAIASSVTGAPPTGDDVRDVVSVAPADVKASLQSADGTKANIVFVLDELTVAERSALLAAVERDLEPPPGVRATVTGFGVMSTATVDALTANADTMPLLAAALAVFVVVAWFRRWNLAIAVVVASLLVVGAIRAVTALASVELSPLTAVGAAIAVTVVTLLSVVVGDRYRYARMGGLAPEEAAAVARWSSWRAVLAGPLAGGLGFGLLAVSSLPLLAGFGIVTATGLGAAAAVALAVVPAVLASVDRAHPLAAASGFRARRRGSPGGTRPLRVRSVRP